MSGNILYTNVSGKFCHIVGIKMKPEFGCSYRFSRNVGENFRFQIYFLNCIIDYAVNVLGPHSVNDEWEGKERWEGVRVTMFAIFQFWVFDAVLSFT
jgi:hypothetical protein